MIGRGWRFRRGRRRLARAYVRGEGVEVGALNEPLRLPRGARVRYVDRLGTAELRERFPELAGERLAEVDVVEDGETLASIASGSLDFVVANHVIEHTEDPLAALAAWLRVLRTGGTCFVAVPDMRHTFDRYRDETTVEHVLRDHREGPAASRPAHFEEWAARVLGASDPAAEGRRLDAVGEEIHFHAWTREGFAALLEAARAELPVGFEVAALEPNRHEFIAILRRSSAGDL
ncbi:MAG TPA: methyltransferase domain-containing protein [Solirubrobacterales bacterium]